MNRTTITKYFQKYGELLFHLVFLWWYFNSLNVLWYQDWLDTKVHDNTVLPLNAIVFPIIFYVNAFVLIPAFLKKKKWIHYGLIITVGGVVLEVIRTAVYLQLGGENSDYWPAFQKEFLGYHHLGDPISLGLLISTAYVFTKDWILNLRLIEQLRAEKLSTELAYLKAQVDPHFLFNTLNSLYALALEEKAVNTADSIAKLGTLMRYNLHDSQAEVITLNKEIDYLQKYIDLQRLRATEQNFIEFVVEVNEADRQIQIAPMLLIPFIENAFKYGVSPTEVTFINIKINLENHRLRLQVTNSIIKNASAKEKGGFGLKNVKKRLNLLYANRHQLTYGEKENTFTVNLEINLSE